MASLAHILLDEGYEVRGSDTIKYINAQKALLERKVIIDSLSSEEYLNADIIIIGHFFFNKELINKLDKYSKIYFEYHDFLSNYLDQSKLISICGSPPNIQLLTDLPTADLTASCLSCRTSIPLSVRIFKMSITSVLSEIFV